MTGESFLGGAADFDFETMMMLLRAQSGEDASSAT